MPETGPQPERAPPPGQGQPGDTTPKSLLERMRANDPAAWRRLLDLYQPLVRFWCGRAGVQGPDAEDATQEVFAAVAAGLLGFRHGRPGDTFRGWLRVITRNQVLLHFRKTQGRAQAEGGEAAWARLQDVPDPLAQDDPAEGQELSQLYRRALEQVRADFEEGTWQAFWRTVIDGRPPAAVAEELGISAAGVRQAKSRVLRRIRQEVGDLLG
jgi:RNA polymerase sigma-70 factor (ECF subfamily)